MARKNPHVYWLYPRNYKEQLKEENAAIEAEKMLLSSQKTKEFLTAFLIPAIGLTAIFAVIALILKLGWLTVVLIVTVILAFAFIVAYGVKSKKTKKREKELFSRAFDYARNSKEYKTNYEAFTILSKYIDRVSDYYFADNAFVYSFHDKDDHAHRRMIDYVEPSDEELEKYGPDDFILFYPERVAANSQNSMRGEVFESTAVYLDDDEE